MNTRRIGAIGLAIGASLVLILGILGLVGGSFELIPSEEQEGKSLIFGTMLIVVSCILDLAAVLLFISAKKKNGG